MGKIWIETTDGGFMNAETVAIEFGLRGTEFVSTCEVSEVQVPKSDCWESGDVKTMKMKQILVSQYVQPEATEEELNKMFLNLLLGE